MRDFTVTTGTELRCRGWRQESILRLLENNLANAEAPQDLVIYGGACKAARDWEAYDEIVDALRRLETSQTLVVQSGKPVGVFETGEHAPLVIIVNGVAVGVRTEEEEELLFSSGLLMRGGMTAGAWQYIGSQGIVQGTYETFMEAARRHFDGSLRGRTILTAGCGGMGGAQPLAGKLAGASLIVADADPAKLDRRIREGYLETVAADVDEGISRWIEAAEQGRAASIGVAVNAVTLLGEVRRRGLVPDIVTDQTSTGALHGYIPEGLSADQTAELRRKDPSELVRRADATVRDHMRGILALQREGALVFEYGNGLRSHAFEAGVTDAFEVSGFIEMFIRPLFCEGIGPFRMISIPGNPHDILAIDQRLREVFADVPRVTGWLQRASEIPFTGLPARICWLGHGERTRAALEINEMIAEGTITGPIAFSRDHLDSGSVTSRFRETENMPDGSDTVGDWPLLNAILNGIAGADLTSINGTGTHTLNSGPTVIADGSSEAAVRLRRVMEADTGLGVLRQADAGLERAIAMRDRHRLGMPRRRTEH